MNTYTSLIEKVKAKSDIVKTISQFVKLKKSGTNLVGCCPFHNEKSASFTVSPAKEIYKCFGCGESGDVITFIEKYQNKTFHESILTLAKTANVDVSKFVKQRTNAEIEAKRIKDNLSQSVIIANEAAKKLFQSQLSDSHYQYFLDRKLTKETVDKFEIGYNPRNANLKKSLSNFSQNILLEASLLNQKDNRIIDYFYDERLMFPIKNKHGKCIAFGGRTLSKDNKVKYLNSRESIVYSKENELYGFHLASKIISGENLAFIVEGYTDVMMLHQLSYTNSVAKCGTSFTESQALKLAKITDRVCFLPDSDITDILRKESLKKEDLVKAKRKFQTLEREIKIALESKLSVEIGVIENGDVCEIGNEIEIVIEERKDAISFLADYYFNLDKSPYGQSKAVEKVAELIALSDSNVRQFYIDNFVKKYKIGKRNFTNKINDYAPNSDTDTDTETNDEEIDLSHVKVLDSFYELSLESTPSGAMNEIYVPRKRGELTIEYGAEYVSSIQRFNGLKVEPKHDDFEYIIEKFHTSRRTANRTKKYRFINWYNPLPHDLIEFNWKDENEVQEKIGTTLNFIRHIFGKKYELFGLDYLTIMYQFPLKKLPAIGLVSKLKGTGKSTFLDYVKEFYGANATMSSVDRITKNFNKLLQGKILVVMEETKDENGTIENSLKDMITNEQCIIEGKGSDSFTVRNFVKVMFASNYETNCLKILDNEDRFAIFRVPKIATIDNRMKQKLISEIGYFRCYLKNRKIIHEDKTRLWFELKSYETEALNAIKESSQSPTIVLIRELIRAIFLKTNEGLKTFKLSSKHLADYMNLYHNSKKYTTRWLTNTLKNENITSSKNATNFKYPSVKIIFDDWLCEMKSEKARYFEFKIEDYLSTEEIQMLFGETKNDTNGSDGTNETDDDFEEETDPGKIEEMRKKLAETEQGDLPF